MSLIDTVAGGALATISGAITPWLTTRRDDRRLDREHQRADRAERTALLDETLSVVHEAMRRIMQLGDPGRGGMVPSALWSDSAGALFALAGRYPTNDPIAGALVDLGSAAVQLINASRDTNSLTLVGELAAALYAAVSAARVTP